MLTQNSFQKKKMEENQQTEITKQQNYIENEIENQWSQSWKQQFCSWKILQYFLFVKF